MLWIWPGVAYILFFLRREGGSVERSSAAIGGPKTLGKQKISPIPVAPPTLEILKHLDHEYYNSKKLSFCEQLKFSHSYIIGNLMVWTFIFKLDYLI